MYNFHQAQQREGGMGSPTIENFVEGFPRAGGFIYILTNKAHPHLQKIGFTTRSPAERAAELDGTGSPHPFIVAFALYHAHPHVAEQRLHAALAMQRVRNERDFFEIPLADAVTIIVREFGADANYFDPHAITPAGKERLVQMAKEAEEQKVIDDRALKAANAVTAAFKEWFAVNKRLSDAKTKLARCKPNFLGGVKDAAEKRDVERLQKELEDAEACLAATRAVYYDAQAAQRAMTRLRQKMREQSKRT